MDSQQKKQKQQLRWLQPSRSASDASSEGQGQQSTPSAWTLPARLRTVGHSSACEECRKRKKKCNRGRPTCSNCAGRDVACEYPTAHPVLPQALQLQRLASAVKDSSRLTDLFSTLPYHEALELFNLIRETPRSDILTLAAQVSDADTPAAATPSVGDPTSAAPSPLLDASLLGSLLPQASRPVEVELMVKHPVAYPVLLPIQASLLPLDNVLTPQSLRSVYTTESLDKLLSPKPRGRGTQGEESTPHGFPFPRAYGGHGPPLKDEWIEQLEQVSVSYWTAIPIPDRAAIQAIALYLNNDYPILPVFNADLFVRDLALYQPYFCSPFLVSALLGWACQAYTAVVPEAASWSLTFFDEAEDRWAQHHSREALTLCSVSALQLLSMTAATHGRDDTALEYLEKALDVAKAMGLINVPAGEQTADTWLGDHVDWKRASSCTAWGLFNWACLFTLQHHKMVVEFPPTIALPGDVDAAMSAESGMAAPLPHEVDLAQASCRLWILFFDISTRYYGQDRVEYFSRSDAFEFAQDSYHQLLAWAHQLPLSLVRRPESSHSIFILHMYFHAIITDVLRPFVHTGGSSSSHILKLSSSENASPSAVCSASIQQMQRLLLCYRLAFQLEMLSVLLQTGLVYIANTAIHGTSNKDDGPEEQRFFLILCLAGLEDLFASYKVFGSIVKGVLGMAVRQGIVGREEVKRVCRELEAIGQRHATEAREDELLQVPRWIVDLDVAVTDLVGAQAGNLAARFDEMDLCRDEE